MLIIQCSPKKQEGYTEKYLKIFLKAVEQEGIDWEEIYLYEYVLNNCQGDLFCWKNGYCKIDDGMNYIIEQWNKHNTILFALPVYTAHMPGHLKIFFDRFICQVNSNFIFSKKKKIITHPRKNETVANIGAIMTAGLPAKEYFYPLKIFWQFFCEIINANYLGDIRIPNSSQLGMSQRQKKDSENILCQLGRKFAKNNRINRKLAETLEKLHIVELDKWSKDYRKQIKK